MTDKEILKKAVDKAIKNGYRNQEVGGLIVQFSKIYGIKTVFNWWAKSIIFSHDFAKAFFGEKDYWKETKCTCGGIDFHIAGFDAHRMDCERVRAKRGFKFHLSKMVLEKNPIKYLKQFLKDD